MDDSSSSQRDRSRRDIYYDQVIEAAYLHTKPGCFYIGPFARRVSFASQQHRGLDLVAALAERGKLHHLETGRAKTVAVIGAGIAGITMMAALRGQGCTVHLYEAAAEPLMVQEKAEHRLIHPNISRWPAGSLGLTTEFAFMDWFAAPSDQVIASFRREWDRWLKPSDDDKQCRFISEVRVTDLSCQGDIVRLTRKSTGAASPPFPQNSYDYAFITTGFAEEDKFKGANFASYWDLEKDQIDAWRTDQRNVYISGCGDGGMIDALRLVHADFDRGWLVIRLAELLGNWCANEIIDAENQALMAAKSLACMNLYAGDPEDNIGAPGRKVGARFEDNEIVRRLGDFYLQIANPDALPPNAKSLLDKSLEAGNVEHGRVTMISRQYSPFGPYSAPIHKLMIAHALNSGHLRFRQGELRENDDTISLHWTVGGGSHTVTKEDGLIIRHGSPANLTGLASIAESESLRIRQFMIADYIDPELERSLPAPPDYPTRTGQGDRFIGSRLEMVRVLVDSIKPGARVDAVSSVKFESGPPSEQEDHSFVFLDPVYSPPDRVPIPIDMPTRVFGMSLVPGEPKQLEALL